MTSEREREVRISGENTMIGSEHQRREIERGRVAEREREIYREGGREIEI